MQHKNINDKNTAMNSSIHARSTGTTTPPSRTPATAPPLVELLTQVQMAQRLGISRRTLHTWVLNGRVPMIKVRGFCRFEPARVWAALQRCEVAANLPNASALRRGIVPIPHACAMPGAPESSSREGVLGTTQAQGTETPAA